MKFHTEAIVILLLIISVNYMSCKDIKVDDKKKVQQDIKKELKEIEQNLIYSSCFIILQSHIKQDYKNIADTFYSLSDLNNQQLFEKYIYENIEYCVSKINKIDAEFIVQNIKSEDKIQSKTSSYILPLSLIGKKLSNPALTTSQIQLKDFIAKEYQTELSFIKSIQRLVNDRLKELLSGSDKKTKNSDNRDEKKSNTIMWTVALIGASILATITKILYDRKKNRENKSNRALIKKERKQAKQEQNEKQEQKKFKKEQKQVKLPEKQVKQEEKQAKQDQKQAKQEEKQVKQEEKQAKQEEKQVKQEQKQVKQEQKQAKQEQKQVKQDEKQVKQVKQEENVINNNSKEVDTKKESNKTKKDKKAEQKKQVQDDNKAQVPVKNEEEDDDDNITENDLFNALRKKQPVNQITGIKSKNENVPKIVQTSLSQSKKIEQVVIVPLVTTAQEEDSSWVVITKSKEKNRDNEGAKAGRTRSKKNQRGVEDTQEESKDEEYRQINEKKVVVEDEWTTVTEKKPKK